MQLKSLTLVFVLESVKVLTWVMSPLSPACRSIGSSTKGTASWAWRGRRSLRVGITYRQNRTNKSVVFIFLMLELTQHAQLGSLFGATEHHDVCNWSYRPSLMGSWGKVIT